MQSEHEASASIVRAFWRLMATNDFHAVTALLAEDFVLDWPQSGERIRGPENFARVNAEYPTEGVWKFALRRLVAQGRDVVTHVEVTDGKQSGEAISFFQLHDGKVRSIVEYWPDPFEPAAHRRHLVERRAADGPALPGLPAA
ncbi:nuclear transport factor 2 family protein [Rubrivivax sp. RP6-9]|uniref:nuclear transport factor 2 family protein n=1 Tax=Rubrivivax sp. RP6-9 TaxID=3415750 RepID=UPI003CC56CF9